jgi:hypothetical protein
MSETESRKFTYCKSTNDRDAQPRRPFLCRLAGLAAVCIGLGTMGEASADWTLLVGKPSEFGGFTSRPVVGQNEDGRLEVFVRGIQPIYPLMHVWQTTGGGWSGLNNLGGTVTSNIAANNNLDGRLEVFVRGTDNSLFHRWQTTPNGDWSGYSPLGGILRSDPTVTRNWDGRMEIFVRNTDNGVSHRWQVAPNSPWSGWENFADTIGLVTGNIAPIAHNAGGGLNLFWRGPEGSLYWKRQTGANGAWGAPRRLGRPTGGIASDIAVAEFDGQRSDPRLVVFVRGGDNAIWYRFQTQPNGVNWSNWISLGGLTPGNIAVASNWDGRLELFVRGTDGALYHNWQTQEDSDGSWSGWFSLGGLLSSDPAVGRNLGGRLEVFVIGTDGAMYHRWQVTAGGGWS